MKKLLGSLIMCALICLMLMPIAYADNNATDTDNNATDTDIITDENGYFAARIETIVKTLLSFVVASIVWALSGFFKIKDPKTETFSPVQFFTTIVIGFVTGIIAFVIAEVGGFTLTFTTIWDYLLAVGFVAFIETWIKVLWRRVKPYFTLPAETAAVAPPPT